MAKPCTPESKETPKMEAKAHTAKFLDSAKRLKVKGDGKKPTGRKR